MLCENKRIWVERIALNMDQIEEFQPPPNPAKLSDSGAQKYIETYGSNYYELDALDPTFMEKLIEEKVLVYRDEEIWLNNLARETADRNRLNDYAHNSP